MSEDEARNRISKWRPGQMLDLGDLELTQLSDLPPNLESLNITGNFISDLSILPKSLRKLFYNESFDAIKVLDIDLPNLELLDLSYNNITRIERVPSNLKSLILIGSEKLEYIDKLPDSLEILDLSHSSISSIQIPPKLKKLRIVSCMLENIDFIKPSDNLEELYCGGNLLSKIEALPLMLKTLNCSKNTLKTLPELPTGLLSLDYSNNKIDRLIELPEKLVYLNTSNNKINAIPVLPPKLTKLICNNCSLITLPHLPSTLTYLSCKKNKIKKIESLPSKLATLLVGDNPISDFESLPRSLDVLHIDNCSFEELPLLPPKLTELNCSGITLRTIPELPLNLIKLYMNNNKLNKLPVLPIYLNVLECSNNALTRLPKLPKNLRTLDCSNNLISKLPKFPLNLRELNCSYNNLTEYPYNNTLTKLNISHNLISELPYPIDDNIMFLDISYNKLTDLEIENKDLKLLNISYNKLKSISSFPRNKYDLNFEGNPVYETIAPELKTPYLDYTVRRLGSEKINITSLPKGTVLFKGFSADKHDKMISDYLGWHKKDGKYSYVWPNFNVFFYPYPFVVDEIGITDVESLMVTSVLQNDVNLVLGVLPSENARNDRHSSGYLKSCSNIEISSHFEGLDYDPCLNPQFISQNQDVVGEIFISGTDASAHQKIKGSNLDFLKYRHFFQDKNNIVGVPEVILHPFKKRSNHELKFNREETANQEWLMKNLDKYNYRPISINKHTTYQESDFKRLVDKLLSPEGAEIEGVLYHMTIDTKTLFFVIVELADEDTLKRCLPIDYKNKLEFLKIN